MFPDILFQILADESNSNCIAWLPHGLAFVIVNRDKLISETLPRYFGDTIKFTSFTRKLQRWKFVRVSAGDGQVAFYNKNFRREKPLLHEMKPDCGASPSATAVSKSKPKQQAPTVVSKPKSLCAIGSKPLKKRPVDEAALALVNLKHHGGRVLPEPGLITMVKRSAAPPRHSISALKSCTALDIERQGLAHKKKVTCTYPTDSGREALFKLLLRRQRLHEASKAKKHYHHHYGDSKSDLKAALLQKLQDKLHHGAAAPRTKACPFGQDQALSLQKLQDKFHHGAAAPPPKACPFRQDLTLAQHLRQACASSSLSSSLLLSNNNERPLHSLPSNGISWNRNNPSSSMRPPPKNGRRIVYDYAHAA